MKAIKFMLCCALILTGCDEDSPIEPCSNSYLPLEVGNIWIFRSMPQNTHDLKLFKRVIAEVTLDNRIYAQVISGWYEPDEVVHDTVYYRIDDYGFVYSRRKDSSGEENRFRLNAENGDTWTYTIDNDDTAAITLSVVDVALGNEELRNCKAYYYDVEQWADEEYTITLANGIGFVKEFSNAWGMGHILESATINGQQFNF